MNTALAVGLTLLALPFSGSPVGAQIVSAAHDDAKYNGLWSVYPYLPSGTIVGSDIERGLFVWTSAVEPVPALSARGSLATVLMIAILAIMTLRHRRPPGRTVFPTIAAIVTIAIVTIGLGCGSQEASDPLATTPTESEPAPDRSLPAPGKAHVEYSDGLVTVRSNGSLQLAILEQLAAQAGFEIVTGKTQARPITLQIDRASLVTAIALILDGYTYSIGYDFDKASGTRILTRVEIDKALENGAANLAENALPNARQRPDRVTSAAIRSAEEPRSDRIKPISEAYASEQAELLSSLDSPDPEERIDAAEWIDLDKTTLDRMISLLESDPDAEVRATIVDRLGEEESPAAIAALIVALRDPDSEVVLRAIEILEFEAEEWLIPELEPLLAHSDPEVREAAQDAKEFLE